MSLIDLRWAWAAGAALIAVAAPLMILKSTSAIPAVVSPPALVTAFESLDPVILESALAAPIFSPTRTVSDPAELTPEGSGVAAPEPAAPSPLLVGIVGRARGTSVALLRKSDGSTVTANSGDIVDGWEVGKIGRDTVVLSLNGERREAVLNFTNKPSSEGTGQNSVPAPEPARPLTQTPGTSP